MEASYFLVLMIAENSEEDERTKKILEFCSVARTRSEIQEFLGLKSRKNFREKVLNPLIKGGLLKLTLPNKPTSPNQKYYSEKK
jgi:ATP-dependent DNA helicase RecG